MIRLEAWVEETIRTLLNGLQLSGYSILLLTVPLSILQGIFSFFPFASLFVLHVTTFGLLEGMLISWLVGSVAAIVCFILCRYFFMIGSKNVSEKNESSMKNGRNIWIFMVCGLSYCCARFHSCQTI